MAPGSQPLSEDQMRRIWALIDILTSLKRRANHPPPTAELILRKFDDLSLPALDTLSILIVTAEAELRRGWEALSSGFLRRTRQSLPQPSNRSAAWRPSST